jgi:hypothetical protein
MRKNGIHLEDKNPIDTYEFVHAQNGSDPTHTFRPSRHVVSCRQIDGVEEGISEGAGDMVGLAVGDEVMVGAGDCEGEVEGERVAVGRNDRDGDTEGEKVGSRLGTTEGITDTDGKLLGLTDGEKVGPCVGVIVGESVMSPGNVIVGLPTNCIEKPEASLITASPRSVSS